MARHPERGILAATEAPRSGYRWEFREGCQCASCPWKGDCQGEDWPHWVQVALSDFSLKHSTHA